ncbi:hypothetical protein [Aquisalibacillus elongatus]|uniref:Uncharacterized protein n=1 Tax=Aquisalibacillus elongatus TaxID=485577 RepID=A0A3N5BSZ9_9BACI|nr:hypothetical protein [Aquisalibacillus elongatus]RPF50622.1 hypothetical protein EDC24_2590 [Aquisalibacillus elongatus]
MIQNQFVIHDSKHKPIKLRAERMSNYIRGQIVEATNSSGDLLYLFFYQGKFLTAKKATKLRRHSFIEYAFTKGMTYQAPHPYIDSLIASNQTPTVLTNKQLLRKLNQHYSKQEKAYILTFFESFISKKQIFEEIKTMFYEFRRNGKLLTAYQLIRVMKDFAPKHSLVKSLSSDLIYKDFNKMYYDQTDEMFDQDRLEAEKVMFHKPDQYAEKYANRLEEEGRLLELVMWQFSNPQSFSFTSIEKHLLNGFSNHEAIQILEHLSESMSDASLNERLLSLYLETKQLDHISQLSRQIDIDEKTLNEIADILTDNSPSELNVDSFRIQPLLLKVTQLNPTMANDLLHKYIGNMLHRHSLKDINDWLEPFREKHESIDTIQKFDRLYEMNDDLDHMQSLGELYYEFKQWKQALECFSMESELKPEEAQPLKWLSKTYLEMGMKEESDVYQKMYVSVQKQA